MMTLSDRNLLIQWRILDGPGFGLISLFWQQGFWSKVLHTYAATHLHNLLHPFIMVYRKRATQPSTLPSNPSNPFDVDPEAYARFHNAQEAAATSRKIDTWLLEGKKAFERRRKGVKILLLGTLHSYLTSVFLTSSIGQSESGKVRQWNLLTVLKSPPIIC